MPKRGRIFCLLPLFTNIYSKIFYTSFTNSIIWIPWLLPAHSSPYCPSAPSPPVGTTSVSGTGSTFSRNRLDT